jgi:hypothetical protein
MQNSLSSDEASFLSGLNKETVTIDTLKQMDEFVAGHELALQMG